MKAASKILRVNPANRERGQLAVERMGRNQAWLDTGTLHSMLKASLSTKAIERRSGVKIACPEEIAYRLGHIRAEQSAMLAQGSG